MSSNWQHQLEKIAERAKNILQTGLWSDCTFIVGIGDHRKEFKAHKLILSMSSAVFDKMLNGPLMEGDSHKVEIVDIQPEAFEALLKYIYTDEIQIQTFDQACELCYVANKYMLPVLVQHCIAYIWKDINCSNVCRAYEFAKLFDQHGIAEDCKKIILSETSDVIEQLSFKEIEKETLLMILDQDELNIKSEIELFNVVEKWIDAEFERKGITSEEDKQAIYNDIISKVRFLSMTPQEFAEGPALSPYMSKEDSCAILINLVSTSKLVQLPKHFSEKKRSFHREERFSENSKKEFCWDLKYPAEIEVPSLTENAILISCNKEIKIIGLKVIGELLGEKTEVFNENYSFIVPKSDEKISGFIENQYSTMTQAVIEKCSEGFRENVNLLFNEPFKISPGTFYRVGIKISQPGWYTAGIFDYESLLFKSLEFNFQKGSCEELSSICGIIFK